MLQWFGRSLKVHHSRMTPLNKNNKELGCYRCFLPKNRRPISSTHLWVDFFLDRTEKKEPFVNVASKQHDLTKRLGEFCQKIHSSFLTNKSRREKQTKRKRGQWDLGLKITIILHFRFYFLVSFFRYACSCVFRIIYKQLSTV